MKRLLTLCVSLIATFSLIAVASISIGRGQPASKAVQYWHLTDCAPPCWAGITRNLPSQRQAVDKVTRLFSDYKMAQVSTNTWNWTNGNPMMGEKSVIDLEFDGEFVSSVSLTANLKSEMVPTLGELMALWGSPTCVSAHPSINYLVLHYENILGQAMLDIRVDRLSVTGAVQFIEFRSETDLSCQFLMITIPWRGFQNIEQYYIDP